MFYKNKNIGEIGENIAFNYLKSKNWKILNRNYRRKSDEIDIIAKDPNGVLVFIEIKTLIILLTNSASYFKPEDNLSPHKFHKIARTCEFFARQNSDLVDEEKGWRIDLIAIELDPRERPISLRHYKNI